MDNNNLLTTKEAADILGVEASTLRQWRVRKLFDVPFFEADCRINNKWYYEKERIEQLKSVYQKGILQSMNRLAILNSKKQCNSLSRKQCNSLSRKNVTGLSAISENQKNDTGKIDKYKMYSLDEAAVFLNVDKATLSRWNESRKFRPDWVDHEGTFYYSGIELLDRFNQMRGNKSTEEISFIEDNIPNGLLAFNNWTLWKFQLNADGKITKVPCTVKNNKLINCDITKQNNLLAFFDAVEYTKEHDVSGIGFAFNGNGVVGIDIDHCVIDGKFNELATKIVNKFKNTYIEYSPSGKGIHIYFRDNDIKGLRGRKNSKNGCECYVNQRFFTVTGNRVPDTGNDLMTLRGYTKKFISEYIGTNEEEAMDEAAQSDLIKKHTFKSQIDDSTFISIFKSGNDNKMKKLYFDGDISDYVRLDRDSNTYVPDNSAADIALMMKLAFYTAGNAAQMERLFSQSKLGQREKWTHRGDYRARTVAKSLQLFEDNGSLSFQQWSTAIKLEHEYKNKVDAAVKMLRSITEFSIEAINDAVYKAAALVKINQPAVYNHFRAKCKEYGEIGAKQLDGGVDGLAIDLRAEKKALAKRIEQLKAEELAKIKQLNFEETKVQSTSALDELNNLDHLTPQQEDTMYDNIKSMLERSNDGRVITNVRNFEVVLDNDYYLKDCVGYDVFAQRMTCLNNKLPWRQHLKVKKKEWTDHDDAALQSYINRLTGMGNYQIYQNVMVEKAHKKEYHPVCDFLDSLPKWDGTHRAESTFIDALGVEDTEYARIFTKYWLLGAVARVKQPGCKFDYVLTIKGEQGIGKSTICNLLGGEWFTDSVVSITGKDPMQQIQGKWIVELGELEAVKKAEIESVKSFISSREDYFRVPYGRYPESFPRQCVFIATVNDNEFLRDRTGNRRFWILESKAKPSTRDQRMEKFTKEYILQIWAEILFYYKEIMSNGFCESALVPTLKYLQMSEKTAEAYVIDDGKEGQIMQYIKMKIPNENKWTDMSKAARREFVQSNNPNGTHFRKYICAAEIAYELFNMDNPKQSEIRQINQTLASIASGGGQWIKYIGRKYYDKIYGRQRNTYELNHKMLQLVIDIDVHK